MELETSRNLELSLIEEEERAERRVARARKRLQAADQKLARAQKHVDRRERQVAEAESALRDCQRRRAEGMRQPLESSTTTSAPTPSDSSPSTEPE